MYGGVATPLALLHQNETNGRQKQYTQIQTRATSSREIENSSYSAMIPRVMPLNQPRLPPLRENNNRETTQNGENEPLLPTHVPKIHSAQRFNRKPEPDLPPPPLPPHKNGNGQKLNLDLKYTPPWPKNSSPNSYNNTPNEFKLTNVLSNTDNIKPYLKPLPKPPGKESNLKYQRQFSAPVTTKQVFRLDNLGQDKGKMKNNIQNPLYHLQRHYSDESLQGQAAVRPNDSPLR